ASGPRHAAVLYQAASKDGLVFCAAATLPGNSVCPVRKFCCAKGWKQRRLAIDCTRSKQITQFSHQRGAICARENQMKTRVISIAIAVGILATGTAVAETAESAEERLQSSAQLETDFRGKPPFKRSRVEEPQDLELVVIRDGEGSIGRVGAPGKLPRTSQSTRLVEVTETAEFARFEEAPAKINGRVPGPPGKQKRTRR
ncbi:MAG: hypothetical protein AAGA23_03015, partial [Pseudomonadota bacterium]